MIGMPLAPAAVLAQLHTIGIVALVLIRLIVASLAFIAGKRYRNAYFSTGHDEYCSNSAKASLRAGWEK